MMKVIGLLLLIAAFVTESSGQSVYTNPSAIVFDTTAAASIDSAALWIVNTSEQQIYVIDVNIYGDAFSVHDTSFAVGSNDSMKVWIYFTSIHNLTYNDLAFVETNLPSGSIVVPLSGTKKYPETLYTATQGLSGEPLKSALKSIALQGHTILGYTTARDRMYGNIDSNNGIDSVECIYTGRKAKFNTRAGATANNFNAEHTWPQSKFGSVDPMQSDIHHLFSSDEGANSARSNYPFGKVVSNITWTVGGSKLGLGYGGVTVFEPRDVHKGDCARAMFYFIVRHANHGNFWAESPYQEAAFREWNKNFPPTQKSKNRNDGITLYQGNRNPFVDHPEFVDRINYFGGTATLPAAGILVASPPSIDFGTIDAVGISDREVVLANAGNTPVSISSIDISHPAYTVTDTITYLAAHQYRRINIHFASVPGNPDSSETLTVNYSDGASKQAVVHLYGNIITSVPADRQLAAGFVLYQNFPNPFNPRTMITYQLPMTDRVTLKIFDLLGKEMATLVDEVNEAGTYSVQWDVSGVSSGIYYYTLRAGNNVQTKKLVLMK